MSRFSTVNLLEVEDSVGERAPGIEGRFGRKHLDSRDLGVSHFRYAANLRSPMATLTVSRRRPTSSSPGPGGCCWMTRSTSCASGMPCA